MLRWIGILARALVVAVCAVVMFAAQNKPQDVTSAAAEWVKLAGVEHPPSWLVAPVADRAAFWIAFGLLSAILLVTFGGHLVATLPRRRCALIIRFRAIRPGHEAGNPFTRTVGIIGPDAENRPSSILYRGVSFQVMNRSAQTVRGVAAQVVRIKGHPDASKSVRQHPWRLFPADGEPADLPAGGAMRFVLFEAAESANKGVGRADALITDEEAFQGLAGKADRFVYVGGIGNGHRLPHMNGITLDVAVHGHDALPAYGCFRLALKGSSRVRFKPARSQCA